MTHMDPNSLDGQNPPSCRDGKARGREPDERNRKMFYQMSRALHRHPQLNRLLAYITRQIQIWMNVGGASVILVDQSGREFYFPVASFADPQVGTRFKTIRYPVAKGAAGHAFRTGAPLIVDEYPNSPLAFPEVDRLSGFKTRNMLVVPLKIQERTIGVLCTVNKNEGAFNADDIELLSTIAGVVSLPIENARIHAALEASYEKVKSLNRAKNRIIHHLSHELKTPLAVLYASLKLLEKQPAKLSPDKRRVIAERMKRNLNRLLAMEYQIEDILRERNLDDPERILEDRFGHIPET